MSQMPAFSRGGEAAEKQSKSASSFDKVPFLALEDGESTVIRWVTDVTEWISVHQYGFLPTKPAPAGWNGNWPKKMPAISRRSRNDAGELVFPWLADNDFVAEHMRDEKGAPYKAYSRTWAFVCIREEVRENGKLLGYRDKTREHSYEKDGVTVTETVKDIQIANLGWKNFFVHFKGQADYFGTLLDRDYVVVRKGAGQNDTTYQVIALEPIVLDPATCQKLGVPEGSRYDLRIPQIGALYQPTTTLEELIMERVSDDYYAKFFDTRVTYTPKASEQSAASAPQGNVPSPEQQVRPNTESDPAAMEALKNRVMGYAAPPQPEVPVPSESPSDAPRAFI